MPRLTQTVLEPRKSPVQARSAASVDAILEATIQVLLMEGKERLTTTKVATRAGVSVGTLYQYFPNKSALLKGALKRHLDEMAEVVEHVCQEQHGQTLEQMATALFTAFLGAKMKHPKTSVALYALASDVDGAKVAQAVGARIRKNIIAMLQTASDPLPCDLALVVSMLQAIMSGVSHRLLESASPEKQLDDVRRELILMGCSYLKACSARA